MASNFGRLVAAAQSLAGTSAGDLAEVGSDGTVDALVSRSCSVEVVAAADDVSADSGYIFVIPANLDGKSLTSAKAKLVVAGVTGNNTIQVIRTRGPANMLTGAGITIAAGSEAVTAGAVDTGTPANIDLVTDDIVTIDVTLVSTGTAPKGLIVTLEFA